MAAGTVALSSTRGWVVRLAGWLSLCVACVAASTMPAHAQTDAVSREANVTGVSGTGPRRAGTSDPDRGPASQKPSKTRETDAAPAVPLVIRPVHDADFALRVLAPHRGRVLLVNFWASYCAPCLEELPALLDIRTRLASSGVDVVFVSVDDPSQQDAVRKVVARRRLPSFETFIVTNDDPQRFIDVVDKTWAGDVPYALVYDRSGAVHARLVGEQSPQAVVSALEKAVASR